MDLEAELEGVVDLTVHKRVPQRIATSGKSEGLKYSTYYIYIIMYMGGEGQEGAGEVGLSAPDVVEEVEVEALGGVAVLTQRRRERIGRAYTS